jgi:hypothetical protein
VGSRPAIFSDVCHACNVKPLHGKILGKNADFSIWVTVKREDFY